ncbi:alpha-E domain-containing protein [Occallatibacter savannae]|uniref:alpha-E domain-containing protein n=1 Tax=Occallatibacter savannae TaxID=1002691 RepID=UPI000D6969D0|nr:alpha-E domain-containing protein [Occallatibacter savannae]
MLSRVADSLYWMSRYLERGENTVRQLDVAMSLMLDSGGASAETHWNRLFSALGKPAGFEWNGDVNSNAQKLVFDKHHPASVACCIDAARENARQIREEISTEQWQRLNRLYHQMHAPSTETQFRANQNDVLGSIIDAIHLFKGVSDTTMIHGQGWHFIRLGRYLERAYAIATLLEVYQPHLFHSSGGEISGYQYLELVGLLRCCTAFEAYCQVYTADLSPDRILEFLLLNRDFPHAIRYSVDGVRQAIQSIQHTGGRRPPDELTANIGRLHAMLSFTSINEILNGDAAAFLHTIRQQCMSIHELMYRFYIQYSIQSALAI